MPDFLPLAAPRGVAAGCSIRGAHSRLNAARIHGAFTPSTLSQCGAITNSAPKAGHFHRCRVIWPITARAASAAGTIGTIGTAGTAGITGAAIGEGGSSAIEARLKK
jgi:hypothetical protein